MQRNFLILLALIIYNRHRFAAAKALFGSNVRVAHSNEFPSLVCIVKAELNQGHYAEYVICSGTLVSWQHVLTAAHCLDVMSNFVSMVVYGSVDQRHGRRMPVVWWISYQQWVVSVGLDIVPVQSDISVIKLLSEVSRHINPSNLSPMAQHRLMGLEFAMPGCGLSNPASFPTPIETTVVTSISKNDCEQRAVEIQGWYDPIGDKNFCSVAEPFVLMSDGDSGGPLLYRNFVVAVNSGSYPRVAGHYHARQANFHIGIDGYRHFISAMLHS